MHLTGCAKSALRRYLNRWRRENRRLTLDEIVRNAKREFDSEIEAEHILAAFESEGP